MTGIAPHNRETPAPVIAAPFFATGIFNFLVPLFFALFLLDHAVAFIQTLRISNLLILAVAMLNFQLHVRQSTARFVSTSAYAWLIALCGAITPLMFRPTNDESDLWIATALQTIGGAMQIYVIGTLSRNPELAAARPGRRRHGLYRLVRHPLYLTFLFGQYGYVLNQTTLYNLGVLALVTIFQLLRIDEEERLLCDDEKFQEYVKQTPWRVIPGAF